jgi:hypothetical protein
MANKQEPKVSSGFEANKVTDVEKAMPELAKGESAMPKKDVAESSAQGEARGNNINNIPCCYHCLNHGHPTEECTTVLSCVICESASHVKAWCPLLKKAKSTFALTCGYAIDGLGFYHIPTSVAVRPRTEARAAAVRVVQGVMTTAQIKAGLERLVPSKLQWVVEELEHNKFKTIFPWKSEMQLMIRWGTVETKDKKGKVHH